MPNVESHAPGQFCWIELATTDQNAAKSFYVSLFGWTAIDNPMGPDQVYTLLRREGRDLGGAYTLRKEQKQLGVPAHWMLYVAVASADDATRRTAELGGQVLAPAFDVMEMGRMAVLQDPTGAGISVWQAKSHQGMGISGVEGTFCWADLSTPDRDRAAAFYSGLFGWTMVKEDEDQAHNYWHIRNGENFIGGIPPVTDRNRKAPAHWLAYFIVSDVDASAQKAQQLGAKYLLPPTTMENVGRMAVIADPQGAVFAIFKRFRSA